MSEKKKKKMEKKGKEKLGPKKKLLIAGCSQRDGGWMADGDTSQGGGKGGEACDR